MFNLILPEILSNTPYRWGMVPSFTDADVAQRLTEQFPTSDFVSSSKTLGEPGDTKMYSLETLCIKPETPLPIVWQEFICYLRSPQYKEHVEELIGIGLDSARLNLTLWRYYSSQWLGPHTDKPEKIVSQIFNFNQDWPLEWGGCLRILRSDSPQDIHREIPPELNSSVIIHRSDRSWHMVTPVSDVAPAGICRRVLTAVFVAEKKRNSNREQ